MQVNLLTMNLVNFEMGLFLLALLAGTWFFYSLILPFLFGFPYCVYWALKGWAGWRSTPLYLKTPCLRILVYVVPVLILIPLFPAFWGHLARSEGVSLGFAAGLCLSMARIAISRETRLKTIRRVLEDLKAHLTPEGTCVLKTMRWPDSSED